MNNLSRKIGSNSVAEKLLKKVLTYFLLIATITMLLHMLLDYRYQRNNIGKDLISIQETFENGLEISIFYLDQESLESLVDGILSIPDVVGIKVINAKGVQIANAGMIEHNQQVGMVGRHINLLGLTDEESEIHLGEKYRFESFSHDFPLRYTDEEYSRDLGYVVIYSNSSVIFQRLKLGFIMLMLSIVLLVAALWYIILRYSNLILRKPLGALTEAVNSIGHDQIGNYKVDINYHSEDELKVLERAFNNMLTKLFETFQEQQRSEEALRISEERVRAIIQNLPSVVYRSLPDEHRTMRIISSQVEKMSGYAGAEFVGNKVRSFSSIILPEYRKQFFNEMSKQLHRQDWFELEYKIVQKNGETLWVHEKGVSVKDREDKIKYIDGVISDISVRKKSELELDNYRNRLELLVKERTEEVEAANEELRMNNEELYLKNELIENSNTELVTTLEQLRDAQTQLVQTEKMASLGVLTAGVAHEINNPLNYIMGASSGLKHYFEDFPEKDDGDLGVLLTGLEEGVLRAAKIVESLNQFSRSTPDNTEDCIVHKIIDNCLIILNNKIKERIVIDKNYGSESYVVKGNTGKLHQVFINIITNAIQALEGKGEISISTRAKNQHLVIDISDNGIGISADLVSKVTDPFFTTKAPGEGTGLGLSITYNIVEEHNGSMEFISEKGKGTTVRLQFPLETE